MRMLAIHEELLLMSKNMVMPHELVFPPRKYLTPSMRLRRIVGTWHGICSPFKSLTLDWR